MYRTIKPACSHTPLSLLSLCFTQRPSAIAWVVQCRCSLAYPGCRGAPILNTEPACLFFDDTQPRCSHSPFELLLCSLVPPSCMRFFVVAQVSYDCGNKMLHHHSCRQCVASSARLFFFGKVGFVFLKCGIDSNSILCEIRIPAVR